MSNNNELLPKEVTEIEECRVKIQDLYSRIKDIQESAKNRKKETSISHRLDFEKTVLPHIANDVLHSTKNYYVKMYSVLFSYYWFENDYKLADSKYKVYGFEVDNSLTFIEFYNIIKNDVLINDNYRYRLTDKKFIQLMDIAHSIYFKNIVKRKELAIKYSLSTSTIASRENEIYRLINCSELKETVLQKCIKKYVETHNELAKSVTTAINANTEKTFVILYTKLTNVSLENVRLISYKEMCNILESCGLFDVLYKNKRYDDIAAIYKILYQMYFNNNIAFKSVDELANVLGMDTEDLLVYELKLNNMLNSINVQDILYAEVSGSKQNENKLS